MTKPFESFVLCKLIGIVRALRETSSERGGCAGRGACVIVSGLPCARRSGWGLRL